MGSALARRRDLLRAFAGQDELQVLAPGVLGVRYDSSVEVRIPAISAVREGSGDVGRYLDALPRDRAVIFPAVISARLAGMLERRGFKKTAEFSYSHAEWIDAHKRPAR